MREIQEVLRRMFSESVADKWMDEPNFHLHGKTPREVLEEGRRDDVIDALWFDENHPVAVS